MLYIKYISIKCIYFNHNVFLGGRSSTANKNGVIPNWSAAATVASTYDIDILRFFGQRYGSLNDIQKKWVRTYMSWMIQDYIGHGSNAVAAENNSPALYRLMATSYEGFTSSKAQEFFNYCINDDNTKVGDLILNAAKGYGQESTLHIAEPNKDIPTNMDMGTIFAGDGDCNYGGCEGANPSSWPGYRAKDEADTDYDWLAYQIAMNSGSNDFYKRLNELVSGNETANGQMQEWIIRYSTKKSINTPGSSDIAN